MSIPPVSGIYTLWAYSTHKSSPAHSHSTAQKQRQGNAYRTQPEYRKRGGQYTISPFALVYSDESYYLLAYDAELKEIRNYRVDRMEKVTGVEGSVREGKEEFVAIDMSKYQKYTFGMYSGDVKEVTMVFTNNMVNAVVDRFGRDIMIHKEDGYHFRVSVPVAVSPQFYGWVFGLGKMVRIVGPEDVRQGYLDMMKGVQGKYE